MSFKINKEKSKAFAGAIATGVGMTAVCSLFTLLMSSSTGTPLDASTAQPFITYSIAAGCLTVPLSYMLYRTANNDEQKTSDKTEIMISKEDLFIGNIVQRTWRETKSDGIKASGAICNLILKEDALLYKTKNGGYVDIERLNRKKDYKSVNKVELEHEAEMSDTDILVMPATSFSKAGDETRKTGYDGTLGVFVDSDSLKTYSSYENEKVAVKSKTH